jgi:XTP/dITP diphosphohydrolase
LKLLLATGNRGKIREIAAMLERFPVKIVGLGECANIIPAVETGKTFIANARIKARSYHEQTGLLTFAEDSGLEVDYLGGAPGCLSARFAGEGASDADNVRKLLRSLRGVKASDRTARFVSVIAITDGIGMWTTTGKCEGRIAHRPAGEAGFGYDPLFIPQGYTTTFARLGIEVKKSISHRSRSLAKAIRIIERIIAERAE